MDKDQKRTWWKWIAAALVASVPVLGIVVFPFVVLEWHWQWRWMLIVLIAMAGCAALVIAGLVWLWALRYLFRADWPENWNDVGGGYD